VGDCFFAPLSQKSGESGTGCLSGEGKEKTVYRCVSICSVREKEERKEKEAEKKTELLLPRSYKGTGGFLWSNSMMRGQS
jgi:hypothetical protein